MHVVIRNHDQRNILRRIYERRLAKLDQCMLDLIEEARLNEEIHKNRCHFAATSLQCRFRGWKGREVSVCMLSVDENQLLYT